MWGVSDVGFFFVVFSCSLVLPVWLPGNLLPNLSPHSRLEDIFSSVEQFFVVPVSVYLCSVGYNVGPPPVVVSQDIGINPA
jgi:hypothetical protein